MWHDLPNQRRAYFRLGKRAYFWQCWGYVEPDGGPAVVLGWTPKCLRGKRFWSPIFIIHTMGFGNGRVTSQICHFPHTAHVQVWTMAHESVRPSHQTTSLLSLLKTNMAAVVLFYLVKHLGSIFYLFIYSAFIFIYKWVLINLIHEIEVRTMFILKIN